MNDTYNTVQYKNYKIEIFEDPNPENPRESWDCIGKMICFHKRYRLGDQTDLTSQQFAGWEELEQYLIKECDAAVVLPLYLYDHSGITISTSPFSCPWDSGQIGFIYMTGGVVTSEYSCINEETLETAKRALELEVDIYDDFLTGNIYGFAAYDEQDQLIAESYEFYGSDHEESGLLDTARSEIENDLSTRGEQLELQFSEEDIG